jgi:manganese-transporting ATPase
MGRIIFEINIKISGKQINTFYDKGYDRLKFMIFELNDPYFLPHCGCHLELELKSGEVFVLVGENGIGKTTLLRRIYSSIAPEEVTIAEQKSLDFFFDRKLKILKEIFLNAQLKKFNPHFFLSLWSLFGLDQKEGRLLSQMSGGESQALKLCLSLSKDCTHYFLDEPGQFLDFGKKNILLNTIEALKNQGKTIILIEHDKSWLPKGWTVQELILEDKLLRKGKLWTT